MNSRHRVSYAGSTITVDCEDAAATKLCQFVFGRFPKAPEAPERLTLTLTADGPTSFALQRAGSPVFERTNAAQAARLVLAEAIHAFVSHADAHILFHAAAACRDDRAILLPATSGAGKSSLCTSLDQAGWTCLSDELVGVTHDERIEAFPRPICLKPDASGYLHSLLEPARNDGRVLESEDAILVAPVHKLPAAMPTLTKVVFPCFTPEGSGELTRLSKREAALTLLGSVANANQLADRGFAQIAGLADRLPVYTLRYGSADDAIAQLRRASVI